MWFGFNACTPSSNSLFCYLDLQIHRERLRDKQTGKINRTHNPHKYHKGFLELHHIPPSIISIPNWVLWPPTVTADLVPRSYCFQHLFNCYAVLRLWVLPFWGVKTMLRTDTNNAAMQEPVNHRLDWGRYYWKSSGDERAKSVQEKMSWQKAMNVGWGTSMNQEAWGQLSWDTGC